MRAYFALWCAVWGGKRSHGSVEGFTWKGLTLGNGGLGVQCLLGLAGSATTGVSLLGKAVREPQLTRAVRRSSGGTKRAARELIGGSNLRVVEPTPTSPGMGIAPKAGCV